MRARADIGTAILFGLAMVCRAQVAQAAEQPLLVVVEAPPGLALDAAQIRRAIETELHQPAVAPTKALDDDPSRALIVAVDRDRVTMSLRESQASAVTRAITSPSDPAARLRVIAWLAGNLARDQVSGLTASPAEAPAPSLSTETSLSPSLPGAETPAPAAPVTPALTPPPFAAPAAALTANAEPKQTSPAAWTIGVAAGPAFSTYATGRALHAIVGEGNFTDIAPDIYYSRGTVWRIEARHNPAGSRMFSGLGLEGVAGSDSPQVIGFVSEVVGARAVVGWGRQWGRWSLDYDLGAGMDLTERMAASYTLTSSGAGATQATETNGTALRPGLFAAAGVAAAHPLGEVLEAVLTLDVHQSLVDENDGYFALTLGLRYRL